MGIPLDHRFAVKLSVRDILIRIGLFSVYSIFTYHFQFFLFNWLSIDALSIFFFDLITDENFQQKLHKVNNVIQQEKFTETILKQTIREPMTIYECLKFQIVNNY